MVALPSTCKPYLGTVRVSGASHITKPHALAKTYSVSTVLTRPVAEPRLIQGIYNIMSCTVVKYRINPLKDFISPDSIDQVNQPSIP